MYRINLERITPRTCLWPLVSCLCVSFALSIGLTYSSNHHCYAGVCGEWLFPLQARLHVVVWYLWISISVVFLGLRAFQPHARVAAFRLSTTYLAFGSKTFSLLACLIVFWICILYSILIGIWWIRLRDYFDERGDSLPGNRLVSGIAMTGHLADVTMGMILLPVSRHSALASLFKISPVATYAFHKTQAYLLFILILVHGLLYAGWVGLYQRTPDLFKYIYPMLNPTYLYLEVWPGNNNVLGLWRASLIFTGSLSSLIMVIIFFTSLPVVRARHFNVFYFTHFLTIVAVIIVCLHASTLLYCTLPGILMWLLDWSMRIFELRKKLTGELEGLGNGWFSLTVSLPRKRISGCACESPLAHFYIHHSSSSIREIHPFTTITYLKSQQEDEAGCISIQFLIRQSQAFVSGDIADYRRENNQWTNKLGSVLDEESSICERLPSTPMGGRKASTQIKAEVKVRLEGPYFKHMNLEARKTVLCLVAGTGLSGAIAIARAFTAQNTGCGSMGKNHTCGTGRPRLDMEGGTKQHWMKCILIWVVREESFTNISFLESLQCEGLEIRICKTGKGLARPDMEQNIRDVCGDSGKDVWAYISGPNGFVKCTEQACRNVKGLGWTIA